MASVRGVEKTQKAKVPDVESLWHFATTLYAHEAVARACLAAQDEAGCDVNLLLYAAWLARRGVTLAGVDVERVEALCGPWQRDVVVPLRDLRRRWKREAPREASYTAIKALELEAERQQLAMLAVLPVAAPAPDATEARGDGAEAAMVSRLRGNLALLYRSQGPRPDALRSFVDAVAGLAGSIGRQEPS